MSTVTHKLNAPIQAHAEEVTELNLRRPTVQEVRAIKLLPYTMGESGYPIADVETASKYIAVCAGIPPSSVNQLDLSDLNTLAWMVIGFFMAPASAQSTD
ncbi:phage tail assembly protein [Pseudomonas sp. NPDC087612]|uniref:phage tail assembly protein n=1 Tax=unclassified Pseudomonas TaxID=196821 RepID=UPI00100C9A68|nr:MULTISPECIES: phage tail assembly protein [unclassified Pseudomonas]QVM94183.1 phage tail assembly protein [Pseudomonas sp. SORT22]SPO68107.1 ArsR family transcriptional regulator [Pseudomonas sp. JV241A]